VTVKTTSLPHRKPAGIFPDVPPAIDVPENLFLSAGFARADGNSHEDVRVASGFCLNFVNLEPFELTVGCLGTR